VKFTLTVRQAAVVAAGLVGSAFDLPHAFVTGATPHSRVTVPQISHTVRLTPYIQS